MLRATTSIGGLATRCRSLILNLSQSLVIVSAAFSLVKHTSTSLFVTLSLPPGSSNAQDAIESNDSQALTLIPKDTFAPAAPDSIKIASINKIVSLFWPSNAEADLSGYNIYRSEDEGSATRALDETYTSTSEHNDIQRRQRNQVGKKYFYQLTAVDSAGNESGRSATVSEIVNP